jgi:hypothetical protein
MRCSGNPIAQSPPLLTQMLTLMLLTLLLRTLRRMRCFFVWS